ncbi:MAG: Xaa-Pro aminopeptidase [Candidatus Tokpelaia sp. JSC161]|jgi:Xaa-Pro aminopeptidase|nr:MAG: Xaa-Pro aminopeptidase [Candidatus Tokpelaia sp. JSC161]
MFQTFEVKINPNQIKKRVRCLQKKILSLQLDGFLVPHNDEYQGEDIPPSAKRLEWLTGFTGSAGSALILRKKAILFIDPRYTIQARQETNNFFFYENIILKPPAKWIELYKTNLQIGFDPWLHSLYETRNLQAAIIKVDGELIPVKENLIDLIWNDKPNPPLSPISIQPLKFVGKKVHNKLNQIHQGISQAGADITILTNPSSIAWCFNIRGSDIPHTPVPLCFAIIPVQKKAEIFIETCKVRNNEKNYLNHFCKIIEPSFFKKRIIEFCRQGKIILVDPQEFPEYIHIIVKKAGGKIIEGKNIFQLPRAIKTSEELSGARVAHIRDGLAVIKFLSWLSQQKKNTQNEISTAKQLEKIRAQTAKETHSFLENISFKTISASGPNSAIIHYSVNKTNNRLLKDGEIYLFDSGGQYRDGTTDITRTIAIGNIGIEEQYYFTLVLKGMISISSARFPYGTRGQDIDILARIALWKKGYNYPHSTGHGVGSFLSVHEGPQAISANASQTLIPGMIISNEPGYYRENYFGIRIENLLIVKEDKNQKMLRFETITLCPIDKKLIISDLLNKEEQNWLNKYHKKIYKKLSPLIKNKKDSQWLIEATSPI